VRDRLHAQPASRYPTAPFSKRSGSSRQAAFSAALQAQRLNAPQMASMRTVLKTGAAVPLLQQSQVQAYQFQSFQASSYRTRFSFRV